MTTLMNLHHGHEIAETFVGKDNEDALRQVKVFLLNGYVKDENELVDMKTVLADRSMKIYAKDHVDEFTEDIAFVGTLEFDNVYEFFYGKDEDEVWENGITVLKQRWVSFDESLTDMENAETFTDLYDGDAFNYRATPYNFYQ